MIRRPGTFIVLVKTQIKIVKPLELLFAVIFGTLRVNYALDHDTAVLVELIAPVAVVSVAEVDEVFDSERLLRRFCDFLDSGGCRHGNGLSAS